MEIIAHKSCERNFNLDDCFFVIDSENLVDVVTLFYGYCIADNIIINNVNQLLNMEPGPNGAYVYIKRDNNTITIKQDYIGSFGIYLYKNGEYFALSNSLNYLVDYLKSKHRITFNKDVATAYFTTSLTSLSLYDTVINEITLFDRSAVITINVNDRSLTYNCIDYKENTIWPDSEEGIRILDNWFERYSSLIKRISDSGENVRADLSGGFDSRLGIIPMLGSGINLNKIWVRSLTDNNHGHDEDYEIASQIANHYGFRLNNTEALSLDSDNYSIQDVIDMYFGLRSCQHRQLYFLNKRYKKPLFIVANGYGGECIRRYWNMSEDEFIAYKTKGSLKYNLKSSNFAEDAIQKVYSKSFEEIRSKFKRMGRIPDPTEMTTHLFRETYNRHHFGKSMIMCYFMNIVTISPLLDSELGKLKLNASDDMEKEDIIYALIFDRFERNLLNYKFQGNRSFSDRILKRVKKINESYPYVKSEVDVNSKFEYLAVNKKMFPCNESNANEINQVFLDAFKSYAVKNIFIENYNEKLYNYLVIPPKSGYFPMQDIYSVLPVCKVLLDCQANNEIFSSTTALLYKLSEENTKHRISDLSTVNNKISKAYITLRLDIKNIGSSENNVELIGITDENAFISKPEWFCNNGNGIIITSLAGKVGIKIRCVSDGSLQLSAKSIDFRNEENMRIPLKLDLLKFIINDESILEKETIVMHDKPYIFRKNIKNGNEFTIYAEWLPHDITKDKV